VIENDDPAGEASRGFGGEAPDDAKNPPRANLALDKAMLFATWLIPVLEGFPRSQRFLLGDRLQSNTLDIVEALIELRRVDKRSASTTLRPRRRQPLEKQRLLFRLAYNLRHLDVRRYEFAARKLDEIGQKVGAWLRHGQSAARRQPPVRTRGA